jgi:hypothetical protein
LRARRQRAIMCLLPPADQLSMRRTVIGGETAANDYVVVWDGITIGRVLKVAGVGGRETWNWGVTFPHRPAHRGQAGDLDGMQAALQGRVVGDPSRADRGRRRRRTY